MYACLVATRMSCFSSTRQLPMVTKWRYLTTRKDLRLDELLTLLYKKMLPYYQNIEALRASGRFDSMMRDVDKSQSIKARQMAKKGTVSSFYCSL